MNRIVAIAVMVVGTASAPGQEPPSRPKEEARSPLIFKLRVADAEHVVKVIHDTLLDQKEMAGFRITAVGRNTILAYGTEKHLRQIDEVIKLLDQKKNPKEERTKMTILPLRNATADQMQALLNKLLGRDQSAQIAVEPRTNSLLIRADDTTTELISEIVRAMDRGQPVGFPAVNLQVRVFWLASGRVPEQAAAVPENLQRVVEQLQKQGITKPKLLGQVLVTVEPEKQFQAQGGSGLTLAITGKVRAHDKTGLTLAIKATRVVNGKDIAVCDLETELVAPLGHYVLLGITPDEEMTSVMVIQLSKAGE